MRKLKNTLLSHYLILIFVLSIGFVTVISVYKLFISKPCYVYVRVKVGQGLWWASTQKPSIWLLNAIKLTKVEKDLTGQPIASILKIFYYPHILSVNNENYQNNQFDIYVDLKIKVVKLGSGLYNFKRSTIGIGSPIDLEFAKAQFAGTIIKINENPIKDTYVAKTIYITKPYAYPWEFDAIQIGDTYYNGEHRILEVIDKNYSDSTFVLTTQERVVNPVSERREYIIVKLKMKGIIESGNFIYGEEQVILPGHKVELSTDHFTFFDYFVLRIE